MNNGSLRSKKPRPHPHRLAQLHLGCNQRATRRHQFSHDRDQRFSFSCRFPQPQPFRFLIPSHEKKRASKSPNP